MGIQSQQSIDDLDAYNRQDYAHSAKTTVAKLPCCGSSIGVTGGQDEYVQCPNPQCPKSIQLGRPCRHLISWGLNPTVSSELQL